MSNQLYLYKEIFDYYPGTDIIVPKYTVVINGRISKKGIPIRNNDSGHAIREHGLDLYMHIGQNVAAVWDNKTEMLYIKGLYQ